MVLVYNLGMDAPRPFYRDPKKQIPIVILAVFILYVLTLGRQGVAQEVLYGEGLAFVAIGAHGGLRVLDVIDPAVPRELGFYDTPGTAKGLDRLGKTVFVADGEAGLTIVDVSNPSAPVSLSIFQTLGDTQDVRVTGERAYLANGEAGVSIVNVAKPSQPFLLSSFDTPGNAQALDVLEIYAPEPSSEGANTDNPPPMILRATYIYIADGRAGLQVVDVVDPRKPQLVGNFTDLGEVRDVFVAGANAYLAEGAAGVRVVNITDPRAMVQVGYFDTPGSAAAVEVADNIAYIADGERGVEVVDMRDPGNPVLLSYIDTSGVARDLAARGAALFVAEGEQGVKVYDWSITGSPRLAGRYETPGDASIKQVANAFLLFALGRGGEIQPKVVHTLIIILVDLFIFGVFLTFWLAFFAQFVLPVKTLSERKQSTDRLLRYHYGMHGPAIFIENGRVKQRAKEVKRRGPGVILLDTASGAVLRNAHKFTRSAGPGVVFTKESEYIAGPVDLHIQRQTIGPHDENADVFAPQADDQEVDAYQEVQKGRSETSGLTRDGVEIVPNITAVFNLISEPGQGRTMFGFNPDSAWRAIAREGVYAEPAKGGSSNPVSWDWLPVRLAADLWREYLRKFTLDELFSFPSDDDDQAEPEARKTAFDRIIQLMNERLKKEEVPELDDAGKETGRMVSSREYEILKERGIRVISAGVRNLRFPTAVEDKLVDQWQVTWLQRAQEESRAIDVLQTRLWSLGQEKALMDFSAYTTQQLGKALQGKKVSKVGMDIRSTLEELVRGVLRLCNLDLGLHQRMTNQPGALLEMIEWLRKLNNDQSV